MGDLITLRAIPDSRSVSNIELIVTGNVSHGGTLDEAGFRSILQSASPASPDVAAGWAFAPWYAGSFVHDGRKYKFGLYLGGLGTLTQPDAKAGLFRFKHPAKKTP